MIVTDSSKAAFNALFSCIKTKIKETLKNSRKTVVSFLCGNKRKMDREIKTHLLPVGMQ